MERETKREIIKYTVLGFVLILVAIYIVLLVFFAAPDFDQLPRQ